MCYIIHFTPSELATLDLIIDSLNDEEKDMCFEAPPVVEENFDLDTPDEQSSCEHCIFYGSIMCEICPTL